MVLQRKRSLLLGLGLTVALVLSVALLPATASASNSFAVGGGTTSINGTHFAFSAHCKLATGVCPPPHASGYAVVRDPTFGEAQGHVCGYVSNASFNAAVFWIAVEKGSGLLGSEPFLQLDVVDGTPDQLQIFTVSFCGENPTGGGDFVAQGNIVVKNR